MSLFALPRDQKPPELDDKERLAWLRLIRTDNVGPITFYSLMETYQSAVRALEALPHLSKRGGRLKDITLFSEQDALKEFDAVQKFGAEMIYAAEASYPLSLAATEDAPPILTVVGNKKLLNLPTIGMVGARNASLNGRKFAEKLARDLGAENFMVASGLARGIDAAAHTGALPTGTIAAVAGGIDNIYPPENEKLFEQIRLQGCIVAESPFGMEPLARHFPKRNRIISGLSSGVVVVEATLKSGSLITARMAAEQGRDVYAVPGHPFDPRAAGPNKLLQDGAGLVLSADDIIRNTQTFAVHNLTLNEPSQPGWTPQILDDSEAEDVRDIILQNISHTAVTVDELVRNCQLTIPAVQMVLLELELAGRIQRLAGNKIVLIN